jgi:hypothetical protein
MNERIRELAIEVDIMAPTWNHVPLGYQKFAQSIVGECIKILADSSEFRACAIVVKHFGVE